MAAVDTDKIPVRDVDSCDVEDIKDSFQKNQDDILHQGRNGINLTCLSGRMPEKKFSDEVLPQITEQK